MDATVNVIGQINEGMGGLKESQAAFRKHHAQVGDALLNISGVGTPDGQPVDKDEARPPYEHQPYPKHMYHADGRQLIVKSDKEVKDAQRTGYRAEPYPKAQVHVGDPQAEKKELLDRNRELEGKLAVQNEMLLKLSERLNALEGK